MDKTSNVAVSPRLRAAAFISVEVASVVLGVVRIVGTSSNVQVAGAVALALGVGAIRILLMKQD
jgi:hypothetical protein